MRLCEYGHAVADAERIPLWYHAAGAIPSYEAVLEEDMMVVASTRHQARTLALQILYEVDVAQHPGAEVLSRYMEDLSLPQPVRRYVERLITGVESDQEKIDSQIAAAAPAFPVSQLPVVDRNILRIAIYELMNERDVPLKAAINEAVELAKRFGGEKSRAFVNGVLGTIAGNMASPR